MAPEQRSGGQEGTFEKVPFRMHPRVFDALGANLVTNDVVAVIELIKNSYDAFAQNVRLRFIDDAIEGRVLEITDDGSGMTRRTIEEVWCMVATPYKDSNPTIEKDDKVRRVVGEKGLGRLSAARLGNSLHMLTQAPLAPCWEVTVDWSAVSQGDDLSGSYARFREFPGQSPFETSGTRLLIGGLSEEWDRDRMEDLEENLARLISPFSELDDFNIFLHGLEEGDIAEIRIESPEFLSYPKYSIKGTADERGDVEAVYRFAPIGREGNHRTQLVSTVWESIRQDIGDDRRLRHSRDSAHCGPFSFEIRAWDIAAADTREIFETFGYQRSLIRKAISAHKGISVYRDGVLVLPKSEGNRDWLGLDLRRVSHTGKRLSTTQLVGYVSISADNNPMIRDTSDRERLASCVEVFEFEAIIKAAIGLLENERGEDRVQTDREKPMRDLFGELSVDPLTSKVTTLAEEGATASKVLPLVRAFGRTIASTRKTIEARFIYYSRLATVGTIAQMLIHEIRNRTIVLGSALRFLRRRSALFVDKKDEKEVNAAQEAVDALEGLADTFSPLASRTFRRRKRSSILEDRIEGCLAMQRREVRNRGIKTTIPDSETVVSVDPGELDAIILNLITNATYWMEEVPRGERKLVFAIETIRSGKRVRLWVNDTGPGIEDEDVEKVFWPGVTRKPGGIGMGLTVASELVEAYGGQMLIRHPGELGGASFAFDLPVRKV
ncbi:MAG: ATP-binding protein [bacterium]|nr:ATP-binding protein [bacterium]